MKEKKNKLWIVWLIAGIIIGLLSLAYPSPVMEIEAFICLMTSSITYLLR